MSSSVCLRRRLGLVLGTLCLSVPVAPVAAAEFPPIFEPELSLTATCNESVVDPVKDPSCPYLSPPGGPSGGFEEPRSIAIDAYGNEYVASYDSDGAKGRIDIFDDEGKFITELLDPHGPKSIAVDSVGNLYAFEQKPGTDSEIVRYAPSFYKPEAGEIKYESPRIVLTTIEISEGGLAVDFSNDHLFIDRSNSVLEYNSVSEGNKLLNTITHGKLHSSNWVAVDSQRRRLFTSFCKSGGQECGVLVFEADPPYTLLRELDGSTTPEGKFFSGKGWLSIAVNEDTGHFFVDDLEQTEKIYEFDENYERAATVEHEAFRGGNALQIAVSNAALKPTARNLHYLFVPVLFPTPGRVLAFKPPEILPPRIKSLKAINIGETEAEIKATIDPKGGATEYKIEIEGPGSESPEIIAQGTVAGTSLPKQVGALFSGLTPGATYSFHAFAKNEAGDDEKDSHFATFSDAPIDGVSCSNQTFRSGSSAALPDCRAYELVTPPDTNGRPVRGAGREGDRFGMVQSSAAGDVISFELNGGILPGTEGTGGFHGDPYWASRSATGWSTAFVGPTGTEASQPQPGSFSPDQGYSFWVAAGVGSAVVGGNEGRYIRYLDGHSELIGRGTLDTDPRARGRLITENGTHIVFQTGALSTAVQLEPNAPPTGIGAVYDRTADEVTHVVSLLPGDATPSSGSTYLGASADGAGIAFENEGNLYLRLDSATTFKIGNKGAVFAGVSDEGKRAFYLEGGDLKAFDTGEEQVIDFTDVGDAVPVNVAPQGNRAYFVSEEAIAGSGQNPNGGEPQASEQNLYLSEEGTISFVATITDRDVEGSGTGGDKVDGLGLWTEALRKRQPPIDPSRLNPSGGVFLFQSRANIDAYDPGEFPQIYRYDLSADRLDCLSCPPTKTPASRGAALQSLISFDPSTPFSQHAFVPNLRADGKRAFFESTEALVSSDTDEVRDVYEWEEEGVGSCTREGGCIYLISSGHSARGNYLFGHSASGDDVFFTTGDVLVGGDEDTPSVYDARVNGGFAEPSSEVCFEEGCKPQQTPPPSLLGRLSVPGPESGNVTPQKTSRKCPKGKHRAKRHGKKVCVKNKRHKRQRR